jgi:hypothetical protein
MNGFLASLPAVSVRYFAARAAVALVLGAAIGLERQRGFLVPPIGLGCRAG